MNKSVKILSLLLSVTMVCALLVGCAPALPKYDYTNAEPIPGDIKDFTNADGMTIDGEMDKQYGTQSVWRLYHKNNPDSRVYVDSYLYFGDSGIHAFVRVTDNILSFHHLRAVYLNSSVELFFNAESNTDGSNKTSIDNKTCQYRIDCGGKYTKLCGVGGKSTYVSSYFDGQFAVKLRGELNSDTAEGFDVEVFIPWYELGFTADEQGNYNVDKLMYNVAYNHKTDPTGNEKDVTRGRSIKTLSFQATPYTWIPLARNSEDGTAYSLTSADGNLFGKLTVTDGSLKGIYYPSYGVDLSGDTVDGSNVSVTTNSPSGYVFVRNGGDTQYYFECMLSGLSGESGSPKAGITQYFDGNRITLYVKMLHNGKPCDNKLGIVQRTTSGGSWNWTDGTDWGPVTNTGFENANDRFVSEGVTLAVYRNNDVMCFFVNGILYFATQEAIDLGMNPYVGKEVRFHDIYTEFDGERFFSNSYVGVMSYDGRVNFNNCSYLYGTAAANKVAELLDGKTAE